MTIPTKVRITGRITYEVFLVDKFPESDTMGSCCSETRQILILRGLSQRLLLVTFIHEVIHAMQFEHGILIPHVAVDQLDAAIEKVLRLNGWLRS